MYSKKHDVGDGIASGWVPVKGTSSDSLLGLLNLGNYFVYHVAWNTIAHQIMYPKVFTLQQSVLDNSKY
jgi:hypothetical protein